MTEKQAFRAAQWAQRMLRLGDWQLRLLFSEDAPEEFGSVLTDAGACLCDVNRKTAAIWAIPDADSLDTIMHEVLEVAYADAGIKHRQTDGKHSLLYTLAAMMAKAYQAKVKP